MKNKLAIIGAGPCGLLSAHYALKNGFEITVFEKYSDLGGVWSTEGLAWPYLTTNFSKYGMSWLDFQWHEYDELYPNKQAVQRFLIEYAETFKITPRIKFNSNIKSIKLTENQTFNVEYEDQMEKLMKSENFDKIIICTGFYSKPDYANFVQYINNPQVTLKISHANQYKYPENYKGKRILVYGHGHSATQIATDISKCADSLINVFRNPHWIVPLNLYDKKYGKLLPLNIPLWSTLASRMKKTTTVSLEERLLSTNNRLAEFSGQNALGIQAITKDVNSPEVIKIAICQGYLESIEKGLLKPIKSEVTSIEKNTVFLKNGEKFDIDEIILGSGYFTDFSFLDTGILKDLNYDSKNKRFPLKMEQNYVFNEDVKNLAFVGLAPTTAKTFAQYEFQAIIAVNYIKDGNNFEEYKKKHVFFKRKDYDYTDHMAFQDKLAEEAGYLVDLNLIEKIDKELYDMVMNGPFMINHGQLRKETWGTQVWEKNAEIIKRFNRELTEGYEIKSSL